MFLPIFRQPQSTEIISDIRLLTNLNLGRLVERSCVARKFTSPLFFFTYSYRFVIVLFTLSETKSVCYEKTRFLGNYKYNFRDSMAFKTLV